VVQLVGVLGSTSASANSQPLNCGTRSTQSNRTFIAEQHACVVNCSARMAGGCSGHQLARQQVNILGEQREQHFHKERRDLGGRKPALSRNCATCAKRSAALLAIVPDARLGGAAPG
jgi:hypothetical protein